jgi:hypothetical protein
MSTDAKEMETILEDIISESTGAKLLAIPRVGELLEDYFAADVEVEMEKRKQAAKAETPFNFDKKIELTTGSHSFDTKCVRFMKHLKRMIESTRGSAVSVIPTSTDFSVGKKYVKVFTGYIPENSECMTLEQRSVYCFVNMENGDILKPAGWKSPAKHARGNIYDSPEKYMKCCGVYGVAYLR